MAADERENVLLQGYPKTGVTSTSQQKIIVQGYGLPAGTPTEVIIRTTSRSAEADRTTRQGGIG